jgi:hypothetical protein
MNRAAYVFLSVLLVVYAALSAALIGILAGRF